MDTDLDTGDTLRTVFDGKVRYAQYVKGYGYLVVIRHFNELETYYAHQSKILVEAGDLLKAGDVIGLGGETGNALGPHLHFEIRYKDNAFDPEKVIDIKNQCLKMTTLYLTKKDFEWKKQWREVKYHKVKSGDTLGHIAQKYNTSVKKILAMNKVLKNTSILQIGQNIRVR
jgi:murein DD-endopeptidase MepM/ murein hydrolase activator NlpD